MLWCILLQTTSRFFVFVSSFFSRCQCVGARNFFWGHKTPLLTDSFYHIRIEYYKVFMYDFQPSHVLKTDENVIYGQVCDGWIP